MSLRDYGKTTIALDKPTRSMLKQLAGPIPVSHYVRALAERELAKTGKGVALPGIAPTGIDSVMLGIYSKMDYIVSAMVKPDCLVSESVGSHTVEIMIKALAEYQERHGKQLELKNEACA